MQKEVKEIGITEKKAEEELTFYEARLGLAKKFDEAQKHAKKALEICEKENLSESLKEEISLLLRSVG